MSSFVLSSNAGIPFFKILCLSTYIIAYGTEITTETICHLSVAYLLIDCLLLVAIISPKKLFVNPVFPTLPWKIPAVFPVKVTFKTSTKKTAKTQTKKLNYTFTVAKASVALSGDSAVAVGNTTKLTTTKKASDRAKITYTSSDETVATVAADGTVTGVKATITAKLTIGKDTATATHEVEVKNYVLSTVGQSKLTELTATVTGDTKNLKASDFTVKNETTNVVYPVSKVSVDSKDATKVTLTLFSELNDAANYDVTLDGTTKSFKASDGKVASIALDNATIPYATETEVKLVSKDANGVVLKELKTTDADAHYTFTIDTKGNGYTNGSKLYLNKVNDTAEATIEYKTGKYDQNGKAEGNIGPNKVTITAVDQAVVNGFDVRIDKATTTKFDKAKDSKKLAVKDPTQYAAFLKIKDANGNEIKDYNKYKVESSDKATLMLGTSTLDPNKHSVNVTAVKAGTAYILIKKDNKIVGSVAVEIVAERTVATLELDSYNVTLSKQLKNTKTVTATVKDQYGDDIAANLSVECLSTDVSNLSTSAVAGSTYYTINGKKVTFNSENVAAGNYVYKISYKNSDNKEVVAKTVSVAVKDAKTTVPDAWRIDVDNNNFDLKVDKDTTADKNIAIQVVGMKDGIDVKYETIKSISVKDAKENAVVTTTSGSAVLVKAITTATSGSAIVADKKLATGTYSVKATITNNEGKDIELSTTFTVKDTQDKASVDVKDNTVAGATVADAVKNALTVTYGETTYSSRSDKAAADQPLVIAAVEGIKNNGVKFTSGTQTVVSGEYFTITKLAVTVKVDGNVYTNMEVSVPGAITIK
jgi:hypothetical protein